MMDKKKLKHYAILFEKEFEAQRGKDKDVDRLMEFSYLFKAIEDAKAGRIDSPEFFDGLIRWTLESGFGFRKDLISDLLFKFLNLLSEDKICEDNN